MAWPVARRTRISTKYGEVGARFNSGRSEGVDFLTKPGSAVYAVDNGVVYDICTWGSQFGELSVVVRHGSYYVVYAHLQDTIVWPGQGVWLGQEIGETSDRLHIQAQKSPAWRRGRSVDPMPLLKKRKWRSMLSRRPIVL
jgi:murein DD-endopeptidase MepM/ murein hydrolase activator NlpD